MGTQTNYSHILADILEKKHSKCICPTAFMTSLKVDKPNVNSGGCQFGPYCQFSATCSYNQSQCTCYPQCTCSPEELPSVSASHTGLTGNCCESNCICVGTCLCKSEESLLCRSAYHPPSHCDKAKCICSVCLCHPPDSAANLLPSYFRNTVKKEAHKLMSDDMMKQECAEIKQLLHEHEEKKKVEIAKSRPQTCGEIEMRKMTTAKNMSMVEDNVLAIPNPSTPNKETERKSLVEFMIREIRSPTLISQKSILRTTVSKELKSDKSKKEYKIHRKEKSVKRKPTKHVGTSSKSKPSMHFSRKSSVKKKPLRIRYYYSGGTEHYGVKLGHKQCLGRPPLVPKHMGWLWNIEDHSKGLRERKGWPPGFIGRSIKNMIQVMKRYEESEVAPGEKGPNGHDRSKPKQQEVIQDTELRAEPPLLHIHKKGRTYNITFCPKDSDEDVGPIPIPFTITEKKHDSDTESSDSTLEFELHSPRPRGKSNMPQLQAKVETQAPENKSKVPTTGKPPSTSKQPANKKKVTKKKSRGSEENKILWEEQQTQIQNIT